MTTDNPDNVTHAFRTLFGLPPAKGIDQPACGAVITDAYERGSRFPTRPACPECAALIEKETNERLYEVSPTE
jgi:hypothetical protein